MILKFKQGQLVKLCNPPTTEEERDEQYWDEIDDEYVGRIGRIIETDEEDLILTYSVKFHILPGAKFPYQPIRWYGEKYLKEAKPWQKKRYNREKSLTT